MICLPPWIASLLMHVDSPLGGREDIGIFCPSPNKILISNLLSFSKPKKVVTDLIGIFLNSIKSSFDITLASRYPLLQSAKPKSFAQEERSMSAKKIASRSLSIWESWWDRELAWRKKAPIRRIRVKELSSREIRKSMERRARIIDQLLPRLLRNEQLALNS